MEVRKVEFWAKLYILRREDIVSCEKEQVFLDDEDAFAESADDGLQEWIKDLKKFGLREHGWKLIETT